MHRNPAPPSAPRRSPSSILYLLVVVAGIALANVSTWIAVGFGALLGLTGILAFDGKPLARSVAGQLLVAESSARRKWLAFVDMAVGIAIALLPFALSGGAGQDEPRRSGAVSDDRGESGQGSCARGLLPTPITRATVEDFIEAHGMRPSAGRVDGYFDQVRAFSGDDSVWTFNFDKGATDSCAPRCVNIGNVPKGRLAELASDILGKRVEVVDRFEEGEQRARVAGGHTVTVDVDLLAGDPTVREVLLGDCE